MRVLKFIGDQLSDRGTGRNAFEHAGLSIEPLKRAEFFVATKPGLLYGRLEDANGFVIDLDWYWIRVPIFSSMGE